MMEEQLQTSVPVRTGSSKLSFNVPCSAKFSRCAIFTFCADCHRTSKIKLREILEYRIDANGILALRK